MRAQVVGEPERLGSGNGGVEVREHRDDRLVCQHDHDGGKPAEDR